MPEFEKTSPMPCSAAELYAWHMRPGAFHRLSPPWQSIDLISRSGPLEEGARAELSIKKGPMRFKWIAIHEDFEPDRGFTDRQLKGPFSAWTHRHSFEPDGDEASRLTDRIDFEAPLGKLGEWLTGVHQDLARTFAYRHRTTALDLARHKRLGAPLRIAVTGASGMVGSQLCNLLIGGGHDVLKLVRRQPRGPDEVHWDPAREEISFSRLEGLDAVVHLAGRSINGRWTSSVKRAIRDSRVLGTRLLVEGLKRLQKRPKVLVSTSAVGFYGDGKEPVDESAPVGSGFLAEVCRDWEKEAEAAEELGIRVVRLRLGVVISSRGGALAQMLPPFLLGGGGPVGSGEQWMSWVALDDVLGAIVFALTQDDLTGAVNVVAPHPLNNRDFGKTLGRVLRRPAFMPLPGFAVKVLFGEMGQALLLEGQRVRPKRLEDAGYSFSFPELEGALRYTLGRAAEETKAAD